MIRTYMHTYTHAHMTHATYGTHDYAMYYNSYKMYLMNSFVRNDVAAHGKKLKLTNIYMPN